MTSFGEKSRECREEKGFSQAELAKQIDAYHSIIRKYERDEVKPTIDVVKKLADVLDTTVGYLLGETEERELLKYILAIYSSPTLTVSGLSAIMIKGNFSQSDFPPQENIKN